MADAAGTSWVADAGITAATPDAPPSTPAPPTYRAFQAPPPLVIAAPTRPRPRCVTGAESHEAERERAALDHALRRSGGMVLQAIAYPGHGQAQLGDIRRGPNGERWMVIAFQRCGMPMPVLAMDAAGKIFSPAPKLRPKRRRRVASCTMPCYGCGANLQPTVVVAEVPAHATFPDMHSPPGREVKVPIDVQVRFSYPKGARCHPRP